MKDICITIFGDSITYGMWDKSNGGWTQRLRTKIESDNKNYYTLYSLGIPGDTSTGLINRFEAEMDSRFNPFFKNIIIFAIGINDSIFEYSQNATPIEIFKQNLTTLLTQAKRYTENIVFLGLTRVDENKIPQNKFLPFETFINSEIETYDNTIKDFCLTYNLTYIDIRNLLEKIDIDDGVHPNKLGHEKIAEIVKTKLETII